MKEDIDLIKYVSNGTLTNRWANEKSGHFKDINNNCFFRFVETTPDLNRELTKSEDQLELQPIAIGFIGYLIKMWGKDTSIIYDGYFIIKLKQYKDQYKNDADAPFRDLENEFYKQHRLTETQWVNKSVVIYEYLSKKEVNELKSYVENYFKYVENKISVKVEPQKQPLNFEGLFEPDQIKHIDNSFQVDKKRQNQLNIETPDISTKHIEHIQLIAICNCNVYLQRYGRNLLKTWVEIADNVMIETISKDVKNEIFKIITDKFENLVIDMIAKFKESNVIIDYNSLAPYFGTIISKFREVFPIENREPQIRYFDTRLILFYRNFEVDIENPILANTENYPANVTFYGNLQFDKNVLSIIHGKFNDKLWNDIDINEFYNNFKKIPAKTLVIKCKPAFCYMIAKYENKKIDIKNINDWMKEHFDILNYSKNRKKPEYKERQGKNAQFYELIDNNVKIDQ